MSSPKFLSLSAGVKEWVPVWMVGQPSTETDETEGKSPSSSSTLSNRGVPAKTGGELGGTRDQWESGDQVGLGTMRHLVLISNGDFSSSDNEIF